MDGHSLESAAPFSGRTGLEAEFPGQALADLTVQSDLRFQSGPNSTGKGTWSRKGEQDRLFRPSFRPSFIFQIKT